MAFRRSKKVKRQSAWRPDDDDERDGVVKETGAYGPDDYRNDFIPTDYRQAKKDGDSKARKKKKVKEEPWHIDYDGDSAKNTIFTMVTDVINVFVVTALAILLLMFLVSFGMGITDVAAESMHVQDYISRITYTSAISGGMAAGIIAWYPKVLMWSRTKLLTMITPKDER